MGEALEDGGDRQDGLARLETTTHRSKSWELHRRRGSLPEPGVLQIPLSLSRGGLSHPLADFEIFREAGFGAGLRTLQGMETLSLATKVSVGKGVIEEVSTEERRPRPCRSDHYA